MRKSMSLVLMSIFALSTLLIPGLSSPGLGQYLFADEVHEYPPIEEMEKHAAVDNTIIGYFADEVHEYPPTNNEELS